MLLNGTRAVLSTSNAKATTLTSLLGISALKTFGCPWGYFHNYILNNYLENPLFYTCHYTRQDFLVTGSTILHWCMLQKTTAIPGVMCSTEKWRNQDPKMPELNTEKWRCNLWAFHRRELRFIPSNMPADTLGFFLPGTVTSQWPSKTLKELCQRHWAFRAKERVILPSGWWFPKITSSVHQRTEGAPPEASWKTGPEESPRKYCPDLAWSNPAPLVSSQHRSPTATLHQGQDWTQGCTYQPFC